MVFSCDDGFIQRGSVIRKCQANGTWSGDATFCEGRLQVSVEKQANKQINKKGIEEDARNGSSGQ